MIQSKVNGLTAQITDLPDFYARIRLNMTSWVPLVSHLLPSDTIHIWKSGSNLRLDLTLLGMEYFKWKRGRMSFLLLGQDQAQHFSNDAKSTMITLNHDTKQITKWLTATASSPSFSSSSPRTSSKGNISDNIQECIHLLFTHKIMATEFDLKDIEFQPQGPRWFEAVGKKKNQYSTSAEKDDVDYCNNVDVYEMKNLKLKVLVRPVYNAKHQRKVATLEHTQEEDNLTLMNMTLKAGLPDNNCTKIIKPGEDFCISLAVQPQDVIRWAFSIRQFDINFSIVFTPSCLFDERMCPQEDVVVLKEQRISSHQEIRSGHYTCVTPGTLVLRWDNSYSFFRKKEIWVDINDNTDGGSTTARSRRDDLEKKKNMVKKKKKRVDIPDVGENNSQLKKTKNVLFQDWFGSELATAASIKSSIPMLDLPPAKTICRTFGATVHMNQDFPISVSNFLPVIQVLSKTSEHFEHLVEFFETKLPPGFPVEFTFPLVPSISGSMRFDQIKVGRLEDPLEIFDIPIEYEVAEEDNVDVQHEPSQSMLKLSDQYIVGTGALAA